MAFKLIHEVAPNFFNIRGHFAVAKVIKLGTQMSIIRLESGKLLVIDTVALNPELKAEIDQLTNNGADIEAVIATHPFHTLAFNGFYKAYPQAPMLKDIPWAGDVHECDIRTKWQPEVQMRIPAGAEFVAPVPESSNHFSGMFVFHKSSGVIHIDDTVIVVDHPGLLLKLFGFKHGSMMFHPTIKGHGLNPTPEAPYQFKAFIEGVIRDWEFDSICAAHTGNKIGGAKAQLQQILDQAEPLFKKLSEKNKNKKHDNTAEHHDLNVEGNECG